IVSDAVSAIGLMDSLDMNSQTRRRFLENKATINSINTKLDSVRRQIRSATSTSSSSGSSGCYIATMAYGDYDHPQVMELRKFRDEFLNKSALGRSFRSEEHTSELQSRENLVCRLLLEKKHTSALPRSVAAAPAASPKGSRAEAGVPQSGCGWLLGPHLAGSAPLRTCAQTLLPCTLASY